MLGNGGKDMDREAGCLRHIDGQEVHPAFHEVRYEGHGSGKPVELGDQQDGLFPAAEIERTGKLRPIRALAALHLRELPRERPADPFDVSGDGFALCVQSEAGAPLAIRRDAVIGHEKPLLVRVHREFVKRQRSLWTLYIICGNGVFAKSVLFYFTCEYNSGAGLRPLIRQRAYLRFIF